MKRKLLFLLAALLTSVGMWASQTPTENGVYYIQNVETGLFLSRGASYAAHAVVDYSGLTWRLSGTSGSITLQMYDIYEEGATGHGLGSNSYTDNDNPLKNWTLSGDATNGYTIKTGDTYLTARGNTVGSDVVVDGDGTGNITWKFLNASEHAAVMAAKKSAQEAAVATSAGLSLGSTSLADFVGNTANWSTSNVAVPAPTSSGVWTFTETRNYGSDANNYGDYGTEIYNKSGYFTRQITGLDNGVYKLTVRAMHRSTHNAPCWTVGETFPSHTNSYVLANGIYEQLKDWKSAATKNNDTYVPDGTGEFKTKVEAGSYATDVFVYVSNGTLDVKVAQEGGWYGEWFAFNGVTLTKYTPNKLSDAAEDFDSGDEVDADTWYAIDVEVGNYKITSTENVEILYSQDGNALVIDDFSSSATNLVSGEPAYLELEAGTFYFKSDADADITIDACTYTVGAATTSITANSYYRSGTLSRFTVTFPDASTNDGRASLAVIGTPVATLKKNGSTVATSSTLTWADGTLTALFSDVALTANSTDYNISIPAGSFGYAGHATNTAISVDFKTPLVYNGEYYLSTIVDGKTKWLNKNESGYTYAYDTGLPFTLEGEDVGNVELIFSEGNYLNDVGSNWQTKAEGSHNNVWVLSSQSGGYKLLLGVNNDCQLFVKNTETGLIEITHSTDDGNIWQFVTPDDYANYKALDAINAMITAVGTLPYADSEKKPSTYNATSGSDAATHAASLTTALRAYVESNAMAEGVVGAVDYTSSITNPSCPATVHPSTDKYDYNPTGWTTSLIVVNKDVNGYINSNGVEREFYYSSHGWFWANNVGCSEANMSQTVTDLPAGRYLLTVCSRITSGGTMTLSGNGVERSCPVGTTGGTFGNGWNDTSVEFTVGNAETADIVLTMNNNNAKGNWFNADNFRLVRLGDLDGVTISETATSAPTASTEYKKVTLTRTLSSSYWNTFSVPFDAAIPSGWTVKEFSGAEDNVINFTDASSIEAGKPYLVKPESTVENPTFDGVTVVSTEGEVVGTGDYKFAGQIYNKSLSEYYGTVAYLDTEGNIIKLTSGGIKGLRAYFIIPSSGAGARIAFDDDPTAINTIEVAEVDADVQKDGKFLIDGKIVVVKNGVKYSVNGQKLN